MDVLTSSSSVKVLNNLSYLRVASHEGSSYFYRNVAQELGAGKQSHFCVTLSVQFYATKTTLDSHKLWGEVFD